MLFIFILFFSFFFSYVPIHLYCLLLFLLFIYIGYFSSFSWWFCSYSSIFYPSLLLILLFLFVYILFFSSSLVLILLFLFIYILSFYSFSWSLYFYSFIFYPSLPSPVPSFSFHPYLVSSVSINYYSIPLILLLFLFTHVFYASFRVLCLLLSDNSPFFILEIYKHQYFYFVTWKFSLFLSLPLFLVNFILIFPPGPQTLHFIW